MGFVPNLIRPPPTVFGGPSGRIRAAIDPVDDGNSRRFVH